MKTFSNHRSVRKCDFQIFSVISYRCIECWPPHKFLIILSCVIHHESQRTTNMLSTISTIFGMRKTCFIESKSHRFVANKFTSSSKSNLIKMKTRLENFLHQQGQVANDRETFFSSSFVQFTRDERWRRWGKVEQKYSSRLCRVLNYRVNYFA